LLHNMPYHSQINQRKIWDRPLQETNI
jgi:hypothetical protein